MQRGKKAFTISSSALLLVVFENDGVGCVAVKGLILTRDNSPYWSTKPITNTEAFYVIFCICILVQYNLFMIFLHVNVLAFLLHVLLLFF